MRHLVSCCASQIGGHHGRYVQSGVERRLATQPRVVGGGSVGSAGQHRVHASPGRRSPSLVSGGLLARLPSWAPRFGATPRRRPIWSLWSKDRRRYPRDVPWTSAAAPAPTPSTSPLTAGTSP